MSEAEGPGLRGLNADEGLRGLNADEGLRGLNAQGAARGRRHRGRTDDGTQERETAPRGWCPSTYRFFEAPDGLLARVKVPGGILRRDQLRAVADAADTHGNGVVEITTRANLQIRGIRPGSADELRADLMAYGLVAPTEGAEDRRNVLASPTAGVDPTELVDVRPVVADIVSALDALPATGALPHKFGVLVDGGGRHTLRGRSLDVTLGAVDTAGGVTFELCLGRALPAGPRPDDLVLTVDAAHVADVVVAAAAVSAAAPGRLADLVDAQGGAAVVTAVESHVRTPLTRRRPGTIATSVATSVEAVSVVAPLGVHRASRPGTVFVGFRPAGPTLASSTLRDLAAVLEDRSLDEVRLTPWRTVVVAPVVSSAAEGLVDGARGAGWAASAVVSAAAPMTVGAGR